MLKESLGGNCYSHLLCTASPDPNLATETLTCLQFASKVAKVENSPQQRIVYHEKIEVIILRNFLFLIFKI